jgi:hypothetical protein
MHRLVGNVVCRRPAALALGALLLSACGEPEATGADEGPERGRVVFAGEGSPPGQGDAGEGPGAAADGGEVGGGGGGEVGGGDGAADEGEVGERAGELSQSNSAISYPQNIQFSDIDGDGMADFVAFSQNYWGYRLSVGLRGAPWTSSMLDVSKVITFDDNSQKRVKFLFTGRFGGGGQRMLCFREQREAYYSHLETVECFYYSGGQLARALFFPPLAPWPAWHKVAVGDFDGDGADELFTYDPTNGGSGQVWEYRVNQGFAAKPNFALGNLSGFNWPGGVHFFVGNMADGLDGKRDDLIALNLGSRQFAHYRSVKPGWSEPSTFWWMYTAFDYLGPNDELTVADADGDGFEDAIVHDTVTGSTRFYDADWPVNGGLAALPVAQGNLFQGNELNRLYWGNSPNKRDDAFIYRPGADELLRYFGADPAGQAKTYWWHYTTPMPWLRGVLKML